MDLADIIEAIITVHDIMSKWLNNLYTGPSFHILSCNYHLNTWLSTGQPSTSALSLRTITHMAQPHGCSYNIVAYP